MTNVKISKERECLGHMRFQITSWMERQISMSGKIHQTIILL